MLVLVAAAARAQISPPPNTKLPPVPIDEIKKIAGSLRGNYRQLM